MTDLIHRYTPDNILASLQGCDFEYQLFEHPAVFTCKEAEVHLSHVNALGTKNLFLKEEKGTRVFLVTVADSKRVDMNKLKLVLGSTRLSFGSPELLQELLGVEPGSVTVLGILNDPHLKVELFIDQPVLESEKIQAHPLRNTASLTFTPAELLKLLLRIEREPKVIEVPEKV